MNNLSHEPHLVGWIQNEQGGWIAQVLMPLSQHGGPEHFDQLSLERYIAWLSKQGKYAGFFEAVLRELKAKSE